MDAYLKTLKKKSQCYLCENSFIEPKLLECFHVFCKLCVRRHADLIGQLNVFKCPKCSAETSLAELNDVKDLKPSPLHARIEQVLAFVKSDKMCGVSEKHSPASWHCFDCDRSICEECQASHSMYMKDHKVVCLSELKKEDLEFMLSRENPCEYHSNQVYEFFCKDCDQCICMSCLKSEQCRVHSTIPLDKYICVSKAAMQKTMEQLEVKLNEMQKQLETLKEMAITTRQNGEQAKTEVRETPNERELVQQIEHRIEKVERMKTKGQCAVDQTQGALDYMTKLEKDGRVSDMNMVKDMKCRSESIEIPIKDELNFVFAASKESRELKNAGSGTITILADHTTSSVEVRTELKALKKVMDVKPQQMTATRKFTMEGVDSQESLNGIAVNKEHTRIAVACYSSHCVRVFNTGGDLLLTYGSLGNGLGQLYSPHGLAFLNDTDLVIAEWGNHRICIVNTTTGNLVKGFGHHGNGNGEFAGPLGVHVDDLCNIIVSDTGNHRVQVFTKDGDFQYQFGLTDQPCSFYPVCTVTHRGLFYVSDYTNDQLIRVFEKKGDVTTRILMIGGKGSDDGQLCRPRGLAIDRDQNLLVCDTGNHRIQKFTLDGGYVGKTCDEIKDPRYIAVLKDGQLLVTTEKSGVWFVD